MARPLNADDINGIIKMLAEVKTICLDATIAVNRHKSDPAFVHEGVPELVRAQLQNAVSLCVQAEKIWTILLAQQGANHEHPEG